MRTRGRPARQAYNAQAAVNDQQVVLAAEITVDSPDFGHLEPTLNATLAHLQRHGIGERPEVVSPTPTIGTPGRSKRSKSKGSKCSSRPRAACAKARGRAGSGRAMSRCARSSTLTAGAISTPSGSSRSSRCSARSNTTGTSTDSCEEAGQPRSPSGD
jgi:hypothetical protein